MKAQTVTDRQTNPPSSELCLPDERGFIRVTITAEADRLTCAVRDWGTFTPPTEGPVASSDAAAEHGRGLMLMRILMDEVRVHTSSGGTTVYVSKVRR